MGTLDDAIRQHLELKRRSGAPEGEVDRLQNEALGPVRREAPTDAAPPDPPAAGVPAADVPPPPPPPPPMEPRQPIEPTGAVPAVPAPPAAVPADDPWLEDEPDELPPPRPPAQGTSEFTAAEARDASGTPESDYVAPDEEGEDLLEETPEFLQETPEHDRLWFEQKPPRDFDFDQ